MENVITVLCITGIAICALWFAPESSKEILIAAIAGLTGFLADKGIKKISGK